MWILWMALSFELPLEFRPVVFVKLLVASYNHCRQK